LLFPAPRAPTASGWSNSCRVGYLPPTGSSSPSTAHEKCGLARKSHLATTGPICILDDDFSVLSSLRELLASDGLEAETFNEPDEFLSYTQEHVVKLAVLDVWMPATNGMEVQERLRNLSPGIPRAGTQCPRALKCLPHFKTCFAPRIGCSTNSTDKGRVSPRPCERRRIQDETKLVLTGRRSF
jgi:CheY-like chemotaxis protein